MAIRKNTFLLKRSNVLNKIPPLSGLTLGELALNTADAKLYSLYTGGLVSPTEVREIGWNRLSISGGTLYGPLLGSTLGSSGNCFTDLYVSNINSCSPLNIQPTNAGNVLIGLGGAVNVGINNTNPQAKLDVNGKTKTTTLQVTSGATAGYVLTSLDSNGNATWSAPFSGVSTDNYVTGGTYSNGTLTLNRQNGSVSITNFNRYFISGSTPTGVTINYGDRWYNTNNGIELVYITDGDDNLWVQPASTPGPQGPPGYSNLIITSGITTSAATLNINVNYYGVNYNGNVDISLPNPSGYDGYNINIKDESGNASIYRIRLTPLSGLIDGNNYVDMNTNYMSLHIVARNNNWWII